jgi:hypothetical protein
MKARSRASAWKIEWVVPWGNIIFPAIVSSGVKSTIYCALRESSVDSITYTYALIRPRKPTLAPRGPTLVARPPCRAPRSRRRGPRRPS